MLYHPALPLRYDTSPKQMQDVGAHFAQGAKTIMLENTTLVGLGSLPRT